MIRVDNPIVRSAGPKTYGKERQLMTRLDIHSHCHRWGLAASDSYLQSVQSADSFATR